MPYDSISGTPNAASIADITGPGIDDEEERMKRSRPASIASRLRGASSRIVWCIVGTAVYQVGRTSLNQPKNRNALKPGEQHTAPPAARLLSVAAISPWIWNSGMMFR